MLEIVWGAAKVLWGPVYNAVQDIRTKRISLAVTLIYGIIGIGIQVKDQTIGIESIYAFLPGVICLLLSIVMKGQVGMGDGWMLLAIGSYMKWESMLLCCVLAVSLAGAFGLFLLVFCHKSRKYEIPFVPFVAIALGLVMIAGEGCV